MGEKNVTLAYSRGQQTFSTKSQRVNILGLWIRQSLLQLFNPAVVEQKQTLTTCKQIVGLCSNKTLFIKEGVGWNWPSGHKFLIPGLEGHPAVRWPISSLLLSVDFRDLCHISVWIHSVVSISVWFISWIQHLYWACSRKSTVRLSLYSCPPPQNKQTKATRPICWGHHSISLSQVVYTTQTLGHKVGLRVSLRAPRLPLSISRGEEQSRNNIKSSNPPFKVGCQCGIWYRNHLTGHPSKTDSLGKNWLSAYHFSGSVLVHTRDTKVTRLIKPLTMWRFYSGWGWGSDIRGNREEEGWTEFSLWTWDSGRQLCSRRKKHQPHPCERVFIPQNTHA